MRWTAKLKAGLIADVRSGKVPLELVLTAWGISLDEYREWERAYDKHGEEALKTTKLRQFRPSRWERR